MRLVLLHGFTQSPALWDDVRLHLGSAAKTAALDVVALDVPHGLDFAATAQAVVDGAGAAVYCGYSMGGRLCLRGALDRPDLVRGLALLSASPGIADNAARAARARQDEELAGQVRRMGTEAFLRRWLAQPLFATLHAGDDEVAQRAQGSSVERIQHQLRALGQGAQGPLWDRLHELAVPVAVVTGRADSTYEAIGDAMAAALPACVRVHIDGGHALPLEQPVAVAGALLDLVQRVSAHDGGS